MSDWVDREGYRRVKRLEVPVVRLVAIKLLDEAEREKGVEAQGEILDSKEKSIDVDREELTAKVEKLQAEVAKYKARLADAEKAAGTTAEMEEWRRDLDARVKIVQKKAFELLDREEKLRQKEEDLKALAERLGART